MCNGQYLWSMLNGQCNGQFVITASCTIFTSHNLANLAQSMHM